VKDFPHPTLLRLPPRRDFHWETLLPLRPADYVVRQRGDDWFEVRVRATGQLVYSGRGPVAVVVSPAPF